MTPPKFTLYRILLTIFIVRAAIAWLVPIDLAGDESYYWEWGRHVDAGFFSKPPLIGWMMAGIRLLGADSEFGLRLFAATLGSITLLTLSNLAREMFDERIAVRAALGFALAPIAVPGNLILTIDAPLSCCWAGALLAAWKIAEPGRANAYRWHILLAATLAIGVLAKQIMLAFPLLWLLWLALSPERRAMLFRSSTWLTLAAPLLALLPPLWWNSETGWVTFEHTASHFDGPAWSWSAALGWIGSLVISQALLWGPVLAAGALIAAARPMGDLTTPRGSARSFLLVFATPLLVFLTLSVKQPVLPNWPAVFWFGLLLLGVATMDSRIWRWTVLSSGLLTGTLLLLVLTAPWLPGSRNPLQRVLGWQEYATAVAAVDRRMWPDRHGVDARRAIIVVGHRYYASSLAFYHPERPFVRVFQADDVVRTQYGIWDKQFPVTQGEALLVVPGATATLPDEVTRIWSCSKPVAALSTPVSANLSRVVTVWRAEKICN